MRPPRFFALLLLALVVLAGTPATVGAVERASFEQQSGPISIKYVGTDEAEYHWYAGAIQQAYQDVQDVFATTLRETSTPMRAGIVVTVYGDDATYAAANPVAAREEGVLGHAQPSEGQIGIAAARLRDKSEGFRRDAVRHELTHIVLGDLSSQRLPVGFQEGIAQYLERDLDQRQRFAAVVKRGMESGQLLSFTDLNRQRPFLGQAGLSYPQSYSMVVFLSERYGFGQVLRLVVATRDARTLDDAARSVFEKPMAGLETEWKAFLPGYIDRSWARNDLDLWDLTEPKRLLGEARYAAAIEPLERAERMFASVGRPDRVELALAEHRKATAGVEAIDLSQRGMAALDAHDYATAADLLAGAQTRWSIVGDSRRSELAALGATEARDGLSAIEQLAAARRQLDAWSFQEADDLAFEAGQVLAGLGDEARTEEARQVMADARQLRTRLGMAVAGGGALGVGLLGAVWMSSRKLRARPVAPRPGVAAMERDWSL